MRSSPKPASLTDRLALAKAEIDAATAGVRESIDSLRADAARKRDQIDAMAIRSPVRDEVLPRIAALIDALAAELPSTQGLLSDDPSHHRAVADAYRKAGGPLLAALFPNEFRTLLTAQIEAEAKDRNGWSDVGAAEHAAKVRALELELLELESAEHEAIQAAVAAGVVMPGYRPPAAPVPAGMYAAEHGVELLSDARPAPAVKG